MTVFFWMPSIAASSKLWWLSCTDMRANMPPTLMVDHIATELSPCTPTMYT